MSVRIDITCQRCDKKVGTAAVTVSLQGWTTPEIAATDQRFLNVDEDDLKYWGDRHSRRECDAQIVSNRVKHKKTLTRSG